MIASEPIDVFLERLEQRCPNARTRKQGDGWVACCPAHSDHRPSLSIKVGRDGRVLLTCHSQGCSHKAICSALGLNESDLFRPGDGHSNGNGKHNCNGDKPKKTYPTFNHAVKGGEWMTGGKCPGGKRVGWWPYEKLDGDGAAIEYARVVRFDLSEGGKKCLPMVPVPGGWQVRDPEQWYPYRLPELPDGDPVHITEGEKAAEAGTQIGITSTTSAHGCKSASKTDWSALAGRETVILPDNDGPGEKYAADVAAILAKLDPPARVKIVKLPGLPDHGDIVEFIGAGGTAEQLGKLVDAAPSWTPKENGAATTLAEPEIAPALIDDSPMTMARAYRHSVASPLVHHQGDHYQFDRNVYRKRIAEQLRADVWSWAERQQILRGGEPEPYKPKTRHVNEILDALAAITQVCVEQMPAWLDTRRPRPQDVIAFQNGLLDVGRFIETGDMMLMPPASEWFSANVLPYSFDPRAQCPQWLAFLKDVCSGDDELIRLLQEFFGLCLTDDTSQQKALLLIGPPRSGKGTTIRQLVRTIGDANCASLRLSALGDRFGLESLAGKTVAVCPDAHLGRSSDHVGVLERLKSIIGEDPQCVDRKFREPLPNMRMRIRFVLAVNNLPDLPDSSVAMRSRLLIVPLGNSYEGAEDRGLDNRLSKETAGVMLWAMQGLKRLREQGKFTEPRSSRDVLSEFSRLSSPALAFVEDRCKVDPGDSNLWVECDAAWEHWQRWCKQTGTSCGTKQGFGMNLKSAVPQLRRDRKSREDGTRFWTYAGIGLIPGECEGDQS